MFYSLLHDYYQGKHDFITYIFILVAAVECGNHDIASSCAECPLKYNDAEACGGDCIDSDDGSCVERGKNILYFFDKIRNIIEYP